MGQLSPKAQKALQELAKSAKQLENLTKDANKKVKSAGAAMAELDKKAGN